jgi:hypothetical protein
MYYSSGVTTLKVNDKCKLSKPLQFLAAIYLVRLILDKPASRPPKTEQPYTLQFQDRAHFGSLIEICQLSWFTRWNVPNLTIVFIFISTHSFQLNAQEIKIN